MRVEPENDVAEWLLAHGHSLEEPCIHPRCVAMDGLHVCEDPPDP